MYSWVAQYDSNMSTYKRSHEDEFLFASTYHIVSHKNIHYSIHLPTLKDIMKLSISTIAILFVALIAAAKGDEFPPTCTDDFNSATTVVSRLSLEIRKFCGSYQVALADASYICFQESHVLKQIEGRSVLIVFVFFLLLPVVKSAFARVFRTGLVSDQQTLANPPWSSLQFKPVFKRLWASTLWWSSVHLSTFHFVRTTDR